MLPWEELRFVLALVREGNAAAAGRSLDVNASTVTRRVQTLEDHLQVKLFDRRPEGMVATEAGDIAAQAAMRIEREVLGIDAEIRGLDGRLEGTLRISAMDFIFHMWRQDIVKLHQRMPDVELILGAELRSVDLTRREADVALRFTPAPPEHLVGRRFAELFFAIYVSQDLAQQVRQGSKHVPSYSDYPWIGWDRPYAEPTDKVIETYAPKARVPLRVSSSGTAIRSIQDGIGVSVLPCCLGDTLPGVVRLGTYFEGGTYFWVLTHERLRRAARVRAFMDFVAQLMERDDDLFSGRRPIGEAVPVSP